MSPVRLPAALVAATIILGLASAAPARAEFFGCNNSSSQTVYGSSWHTSSHYARYTHAYASQPRRVAHTRVTYSGAPRYYVSHYR